MDVGQVPESVGRFTADILGLDRKSWNKACFGPAHVIWEPSEHFDNILQLALSIDPDISHERVAEAVEERQARFDHSLIHVDPASLSVLQSLRDKNLKLGLISNASSSEVQAWRQSPLADYFDVATFSCDCGHIKPNPPIYQETLQALGVEAGQCLFIGDGGSDEHFGAHEVGMKPVLISHYLDAEEYTSRMEKYREVLHGDIRHLSELEASSWWE